MQTVCKRHANAMQTVCKCHANGMHEYEYDYEYEYEYNYDYTLFRRFAAKELRRKAAGRECRFAAGGGGNIFCVLKLLSIEARRAEEK